MEVKLCFTFYENASQWLKERAKLTTGSWEAELGWVKAACVGRGCVGQNDLVKWSWFLSQPAVTGSRSKKLFVLGQCRSLLWSGSRNRKVSCAYLRDKNNLLLKARLWVSSSPCFWTISRLSCCSQRAWSQHNAPGLSFHSGAKEHYLSPRQAGRHYSSTLPFPNMKLLPVCPVSSLMSLTGVTQLLGAGS